MATSTLDRPKTAPRRMLSPIAYSETALPSLKLARSSRWARALGKLLAWMLAMGFLLVAIAT